MCMMQAEGIDNGSREWGARFVGVNARRGESGYLETSAAARMMGPSRKALPIDFFPSVKLI